MIEIQNLEKSFGNEKIFSDFNLSVKKGEFIILSGASGCGKTTLLNMIGALESFEKGKIFVEGFDIKEKKHVHNYFTNVVGFLFQNFVLIEDKTIAQNLNMIKKGNRSGVSMTSALSRVGLSEKINHKVYTLSGGEQQRVSLARLMIKKCDIILADEPTGSLDKKNAKQVMDILKKMNEDGKTIVLVTHDEEIKKNGKRVIEL